MPKKAKSKKAKDKKPTFEESILFVNREIQKRKNKWNLTSLNWMDYDDVSQIIRIHINEKWHLYDPEKPLGPWLNRIITNQIKNIIRNNYGNYVRPCLRCAAAEGESGCRIYETQCKDCPLYEHWEKTKKGAYDLKIPLPMEGHLHEINSIDWGDSIDLEGQAKKLHRRMKQILKPIEWKVYDSLYIKHEDEESVAVKLGYTTSEKGRNPGYKQIKNIKKNIMIKVKKCLTRDEIDIF